MASHRLLVTLGASLGTLGAAGVAAVFGSRHLLERQAEAARQMIGTPHGWTALAADKTYKKRYGDRIDLVLLGDSIAAGLGADEPRGTLGARLAKGTAKKARRSVRLRTVARVGAESSMLAEQVEQLEPGYHPDVAVIVVGGNDVTHRVPATEAARSLAECVGELQARGAEVVVGTCPDLGALGIPQPLRALGSRFSRQLAMAQRQAVMPLGAYVVDLAKVVGPFFITNPDEMFSLDRFHPSSQGYKRTAKAMLPSVLAALHVRDDVPFGHHAPRVPPPEPTCPGAGQTPGRW